MGKDKLASCWRGFLVIFDADCNRYTKMENHQNENEPNPAPKAIPADGKLDLSDFRRPINERIRFGPQRPYQPRPVLPFSPNTKAENASSDESESAANAMTEDFKVSMSRGSYYNDNADLDQQRQEYWDSL